MDNHRENLFVVGQLASGASFFGRQRMIRELETIIITGRGARNLVGPTRIGKSSLINQVISQNRDRPRHLFVTVSMGDYPNAFAFWMAIAANIRITVKRGGLWNPIFEEAYSALSEVRSDDPDWFTRFQTQLYLILSEICYQNFQLVLVIDEFDAVERIFGQEAHYFQTLRSIYDHPDFGTSGVLVSRRRLHLFEAKCEYISTFHGIFPEMTVLPFSQEDMKDFYAMLDCYDIKLSDSGKKRLERFTGNMPYLCCMFGDRMVLDKVLGGENNKATTLSAQEINSVFERLRPQIDRHYDDLIKRLEEDGHLEFIFYLSVDSCCPNITDRDRENMRQMGILFTDDSETPQRYYAFSKDFMSYFRLKPLKLPVWETMTNSELKLKRIFLTEYPELGQISYADMTGPDASTKQSQIDRSHPELALNWPQIKRFLEDLIPYKPDAAAIDALTLSKVVGIILDKWTGNFAKYFQGEVMWKGKLEKIKTLRNPMAHAQLAYIDSKDLAVCLKYCDELIRLHY